MKALRKFRYVWGAAFVCFSFVSVAAYEPAGGSVLVFRHDGSFLRGDVLDEYRKIGDDVFIEFVEFGRNEASLAPRAAVVVLSYEAFQTQREKNRLGAFLRSAFLPGWGTWYGSGEQSRAAIFLAASAFFTGQYWVLRNRYQAELERRDATPLWAATLAERLERNRLAARYYRDMRFYGLFAFSFYAYSLYDAYSGFVDYGALTPRQIRVGQDGKNSLRAAVVFGF